MKKYKLIKDTICSMSVDTGNGTCICTSAHVNAGQIVTHIKKDKQFPLVTTVIIEDPMVTYQILDINLEEIKWKK